MRSWRVSASPAADRIDGVQSGAHERGQHRRGPASANGNVRERQRELLIGHVENWRRVLLQAELSDVPDDADDRRPWRLRGQSASACRSDPRPASTSAPSRRLQWRPAELPHCRRHGTSGRRRAECPSPRSSRRNRTEVRKGPVGGVRRVAAFDREGSAGVAAAQRSREADADGLHASTRSDSIDHLAVHRSL